MNDKDLRNLTRAELLQMLVMQTEENQRLKKELQDAKEELESRKIIFENAGSLAEAALQVNGVFAAAERAASQYLENIEEHASRQKELLDRAEQEANRKAALIIAEADAYKARSKELADEYWNDIRSKVKSLMSDQ